MNTRNVWSLASKVFILTCFAGAALFADDGQEPTEQPHVPVGERAISHADHVRMLEERALLVREGQEAETSDEEQQEAVFAFSEEESSEDGKVVQKAALYVSTHEGAFHRPIAVSLLGDTVELEDGSIWVVSSDHRYRTLDWMTSDVIVITPNHDWFSSYNYRLININTGASVKVNLALGPIYNGYFTHWIIAIDYLNRDICLEDGSVWKISSVDSSAMNKWLPNDTVIMGINDGWYSGSNPNILINVNVNNYAIGKCIF